MRVLFDFLPLKRKEALSKLDSMIARLLANATEVLSFETSIFSVFTVVVESVLISAADFSGVF